jgi:hypothetical protein
MSAPQSEQATPEQVQAFNKLFGDLAVLQTRDVTPMPEPPEWLLGRADAIVKEIDGRPELITILVCTDCHRSMKTCQCGGLELTEHLLWNRSVGLNELLVRELSAAAANTQAADAVPEPASSIEPGLLQLEEFVYSIFKPTDTICFMTLLGKIPEHEFILARDAIKPEYYEHLKALNADRSIYIGMNAYNPELIGESKGRTKENVVAVRTLYIDADENGPERKNTILSSKLVPEPTVVLESSPNKF